MFKKWLENRLIKRKVKQFLDFNNAWYENPTATNLLCSFVTSDTDKMKVEWKIKDTLYYIYLGEPILYIKHKQNLQIYKFFFPDKHFEDTISFFIKAYFMACAKENSTITYRYANLGIQTKVGESNIILRLRIQENMQIDYVFSYVQGNKKYSDEKETANQEYAFEKNLKEDSIFFLILRSVFNIDNFYTDFNYGYYENECEMPIPGETLVEKDREGTSTYKFSKFFKHGPSVIFIKGLSSIYKNSEVVFKLRDKVILDNANNLKLHENLYDDKFEYMAGKIFEIQSFTGRFVNCIEILDEKTLGEASIHRKNIYVFNLESIKKV